MFKNHFWKCYWKFADQTLMSEPDHEDSLLDYTKDKIERLKRMFPEMTSKSIITLCILDLPAESRPKLQKGIHETIEIFLRIVESLDRQLKRFKGQAENDDVCEFLSSNEDEDEGQEPDREPDGLGNQEPINPVLEERIIQKVVQMQEDQFAKLNVMIESAFLDEKLAKIIESLKSKTT